MAPRPLLNTVLIAALLNVSCTLGGATAGLLIASTEPTYQKQPLPSPAEPPAAFSPGDHLRIVVRTGASVHGEYVRFQAAGPTDADSYLIIRQMRDRREQLQSIALSEVQSVELEDHDYSYVGLGALIGLVVDVVFFGLVTDWFKDLST